MKRIEMVKNFFDSHAFNGKIHILEINEFSSLNESIRMFLNINNNSNTIFLDMKKLKFDFLKIAPVLFKYISLLKVKKSKYKLIIDNAQCISNGIDPSKINGRIVRTSSSKYNIYNIDTMIMNLYDSFIYDIYLIFKEKHYFSDIFFKNMKNKVDYFNIDIKQYKNINNNIILKNKILSIKNKYSNIIEIERLDELIKVLLDNLGNKFSYSSLKNKIDNLSIKNVKTLLNLLENNFIIEKIGCYDLNDNYELNKYFITYFNDIDYLLINKNNKKIIKNLIYLKLKSYKIKPFLGCLNTYKKIKNKTKRNRIYFDFVFVYKNEKYILNYYDYSSLLKIKECKKIFLTSKKIKTFVDENDIINMNLDIFLSQ